MWLKFRLAVLVGSILAVGAPGARTVFSQDVSGTALADQLKGQYKLAKRGFDSGGNTITDSGTVLVLKKGGILGVPPAVTMIPTSTFKDGELHSPSAGARMFSGNDTRLLTVGEKIFVTRIDVHPKNDKIMMTIVECDSCNGVQQASSYKAAVIFQFPKDYLSKADVTQIKDVISLVLAPDTTEQQQQVQPQEQQAPDQSAPTPQTIQLGQTLDQVRAALGQPEKIVDLGQKQIYVYKDLKITFVSGKVADVQ
jgi:hypothetical protein